VKNVDSQASAAGTEIYYFRGTRFFFYNVILGYFFCKSKINILKSCKDNSEFLDAPYHLPLMLTS
jgi:hypothetical protein